MSFLMHAPYECYSAVPAQCTILHRTRHNAKADPHGYHCAQACLFVLGARCKSSEQVSIPRAAHNGRPLAPQAQTSGRRSIEQTGNEMAAGRAVEAPSQPQRRNRTPKHPKQVELRPKLKRAEDRHCSRSFSSSAAAQAPRCHAFPT